MATSIDTLTNLLDGVERLRPMLEENRPLAEAERRVPDASYQAMLDAGLFDMMAPKAYGGLEMHLVDVMRVWEAVARIDSAAAWNLVMNQAVATFAAWLPPQGAQEMFGDGPTTLAGAFFPPALATRVDGGWRITGQVGFASGCHNASWLLMPAVEMDGDQPKVDPVSGQPAPFGTIFPREQAEILDTWHTFGLRGTGSADIAVTDLFVPDHRTFPAAPLATLEGVAPGFEGPLYRTTPLSAVLGEATVGVGVAASALDEVIELVMAKTPNYNVIPLREQPWAQSAVAKATARVNASRDTLHAAARDAYADAEVHDRLSWETKTRVQVAVSFAAEACAEAVRFVNEAAGSSAIRLGNSFERHFRDAHVMTQHASKSAPRYASAGRLIFNLENDWIWLSF